MSAKLPCVQCLIPVGTKNFSSSLRKEQFQLALHVTPEGRLAHTVSNWYEIISAVMSFGIWHCTRNQSDCGGISRLKWES